MGKLRKKYTSESFGAKKRGVFFFNGDCVHLPIYVSDQRQPHLPPKKVRGKGWGPSLRERQGEEKRREVSTNNQTQEEGAIERVFYYFFMMDFDRERGEEGQTMNNREVLLIMKIDVIAIAIAIDPHHPT